MWKLFPFLFLGLTRGQDSTIASCSDPKTTGPVLNGIDIVETFTSAAAGNATVPPVGSEKFSYTDDEGFEWHFISQANMNSYLLDPSKYPIGAGGYCSLAISGNDPACNYEVCTGPACLDSADTHAVYNGKLYFFLGSGARHIFEEDLDTNLANVDTVIAGVEDLNGISCRNDEIFRCQ